MPRRSGYAWVYSPRKPKPPKITAAFKAEAEAKMNNLIENVLKPRCLKPPPTESQSNYIVDVYSKWHGSSLFLCAQWACPHPQAIAPFFDVKNSRLQYASGRNFNLAFMRYTGTEWVEMETGRSLEECLELIKNDDVYFS